MCLDNAAGSWGESLFEGNDSQSSESPVKAGMVMSGQGADGNSRSIADSAAATSVTKRQRGSFSGVPSSGPTTEQEGKEESANSEHDVWTCD